MLIKNSFKNDFEKEDNIERKASLLKDYSNFMKKFDSVRNASYKFTLIKVRNTEDLENIKGLFSSENAHTNPVENSTTEIISPEYPNGINSLREQIAELIYTETINYVNLTAKTEVSFIVERDGSITEIKANGEIEEFNKQAEIAMYLLPDKFSKPAYFKGNAVRYHFKLPLKINFE